MAIEKIPREDFPKRKNGLSEESASVMDLQPGEAVKFPCRWPHTTSINNDRCHANAQWYAAARRRGFRVSIRCRDKMVYVMRRIGENN
jgi:hypothetical protein